MQKVTTHQPCGVPAAAGAVRARPVTTVSIAILETAERLLEHRPLAGSPSTTWPGRRISRPTFYFYFPSKDAVLLTLLERVIAEADAALAEIIAARPTDRRAFWRHGIDVFRPHVRGAPPVCAATVGVRTTDSAAREMWARSMQRWIDHSATVIEAERAAGAAP